MNSKELRIGNLIQFNENGEKFLVYEIASSGFRVRNKSEDTWIEVWQFEGIPLTEEWLMKANIMPSHKLGFRRFYSLGNLSFEICKTNVAVYFKEELMCFIDHVHQLQNLFMFWGQELEFKLK
jgi:hypothetical protein